MGCNRLFRDGLSRNRKDLLNLQVQVFLLNTLYRLLFVFWLYLRPSSSSFSPIRFHRFVYVEKGCHHVTHHGKHHVFLFGWILSNIATHITNLTFTFFSKSFNHFLKLFSFLRVLPKKYPGSYGSITRISNTVVVFWNLYINGNVNNQKYRYFLGIKMLFRHWSTAALPVVSTGSVSKIGERGVVECDDRVFGGKRTFCEQRLDSGKSVPCNRNAPCEVTHNESVVLLMG